LVALRAVKYSFLVLLLLLFFGFSADVVRLNPAQMVSLPYSFSILGWHVDNILSKWTHRLMEAIPWTNDRALDDKIIVTQYLRMGDEIVALEAQIRRYAAANRDLEGSLLLSLNTELTDLKSSRRELRPDVEEVIESTISSILGQEGIASWGELIFPPVDIRLEEPPMLLVTSPRDRIKRGPEVLLNHDVGLAARENMETDLAVHWDLSAVVVEIGGLATFPTSVNNRQTLEGIFNSASHEWVHHYLVARLRPLGLNIYRSEEMLTLNETFADIVGDEIGERAVLLFKDELDSRRMITKKSESYHQRELNYNNEFDFRDEMHQTRLHADELLGEGFVEEAEKYMEERRQVFVGNGYYIRKLNQAYFAFHGTYGDRGESSSPVAGLLQEFRTRTPDLKTFMVTVSEFSTYRQFLDARELLMPETSFE